MDEKATLIDVTKCMGCRGCQVACKQWNQLPAVNTKNDGSYENPPGLSSETFTKVVFREQVIDGKLKWLFRKEQCMHCNKAVCVEICPVDARGKDEYGFVEINRDKCIGCGLCVAVCPYEVPHLDNKKKAVNCWFCLDRVINGLQPACAKACPTGAIKYGNRLEMRKLGLEAVARSNGKLYLYGDKEFQGLHVFYLLSEKPSFYGFPSAEGAVMNKLEIYAMLEKNLADSPHKTEVLTMAALKYFGNVHI